MSEDILKERLAKIMHQEAQIEALNDELKFYKSFVDYLGYHAIGDIRPIIDAVNDNSNNEFVGYVTVEKEIQNNQIILKFKIEDGDVIEAVWQPSDNYAVHQRTGCCGDDYYGYLLYPTNKENEYFCQYYSC